MTGKTFSWMAGLCGWLFKFEGYSYKARYLRKKGDKKKFDAYVQERVNYLSEAVEKSAGLTYTIEGKEKIPSSGPVVYACNHQSIFDTTAVVRTSRDLPGFIMKHQLRMIPLTRLWFSFFDCVYVNRKDKESSHKAYEAGVQNLKNGRSMAIFMEGTRSRDEKHKLGKFKTGAFRMAMEAGVPLVPVIICGTSKAFEDTGEIVSAMGKVKVLDPIMIPKMDFDDLEDFIKDFREKYEDEYEDVFEEVEDMNKNFNR